MTPTFNRVRMKQASGISIIFNFGMLVAARHDIIKGWDNLGFFLAASMREFITYLISLSTSPAWPGKTQIKTMSLSFTIFSLLNSAVTPKS